MKNMPNQEFSNQPLTAMNLYQHAQGQAILSIYSGDIVDLKILWSDWLKAFSHTSQKQNFSQLWDLCRDIAKIVLSSLEQIQKKLRTKFFNKLKNPYFLPILEAKTFFKKSGTISMGLETMPKFRKN